MEVGSLAMDEDWYDDPGGFSLLHNSNCRLSHLNSFKNFLDLRKENIQSIHPKSWLERKCHVLVDCGRPVYEYID